MLLRALHMADKTDSQDRPVQSVCRDERLCVQPSGQVQPDLPQVPGAAATSSSVALLGEPAGNLLPLHPPLTCRQPPVRESAVTSPFRGHRSSPPRLPLFLGVRITLLRGEVQSPSQLAKQETPSPRPTATPHSASLGSPLLLSGLSLLCQVYHLHRANSGGRAHSARRLATRYHLWVSGHPSSPPPRGPRAPPYLTATHSVNYANCLAAFQGWAGSCRIQADRRKFLEPWDV